MLDMGFLEPVEKIAAATRSTRQTLLFSATLQGSVIKLSERLLNKPMEITVQGEERKELNITQNLYIADDMGHKNRLLDHILSQEDTGPTLIFTSTKRHADQLAQDLREKQYSVAPLHGDMNQNKRSRTIMQLRKGKIKIVVATDVAARGIDVRSITHVINYDLPTNVEDYVHRIGRTGRAGAAGTALSFVSHRDAPMMKKIQEFTRQPVMTLQIVGLEPSTKPRKSKSTKKPPFHARKRGPKRAFKSRKNASGNKRGFHQRKKER